MKTQIRLSLVVSSLGVVTGILAFASAVVGQDKNVANKQEKKIDQTGIDWVMPFPDALAKAKKENRILAIKMIAFGTNSTGCW